MFNSIKKKLAGGFAIIILIVTLGTGYNVYSFIDSKEHISIIKEAKSKEVSISNNMKNDILQVRVYLTDVSASKNISELKKAEEHSISFKKNSEELLKIDKGLNGSVSELSSEFDKFYDYGKDMSGAYIKDDHNEANKMMGDFDKLADSVTQKIDLIQKQNEKDMEESLKTIDMHMSMNITTGIGITIVTMIISLIIAIILGEGIRNPIINLLNIFVELEKGEGDLTKRIELKSKDELGKMALAFNRFMDTMEKMVTNIKKNSIIVSNGASNLSSSGNKTTEEISELNNNMLRVTDDTQTITESINEITMSISEIAQISQNTAADAQDISTSAVEVNNLAEESQKHSQAVKKEMENIEKVSQSTMEVVKKLGDEANQIGKIVDTIKAITAQTNLLALNASIEAARAGENGKGFGVVANEIRKLAEGSDESTSTIEKIVVSLQNMIADTISATAEVGKNIKIGAKMVEGVYDQLKRITMGIRTINERIQNIASSTEEQGASTEELSSVMDSINSSNNQISASVQQISSGISTETETIKNLSFIAGELNESAFELQSLVNKFKIKE